MLIWLCSWLPAAWPDAAAALSAATKITFRSALAALVGFAAALALGPSLISWLRRRFIEPNGSPSPHLRQLHAHKQTTPTMGGLFLVAGLVVAMILLCDLGNRYLPVVLLTWLGLAAVGSADDLAKLTRRRGLSVRVKLAGQFTVAGAAAIVLHGLQRDAPGGLDLLVPGFGKVADLGWWFVPWSAVVIVAASNAVNLTDGLDGLAGGALIPAISTLALAVYACGHAGWAEYLSIPHFAGAGELAVVAAGLIGGTLGFLWFNCQPAQVFMGDTGSLPLGGMLGLLAVIARQEILLLITGGVFVTETASVILQVGYFRWKRRRLLRCAPLHHHFQFAGWSEGKIVVRFWIASALCALAGLALLKAQVAEVDVKHPGAKNSKSFNQEPAATEAALKNSQPRRAI